MDLNSSSGDVARVHLPVNGKTVDAEDLQVRFVIAADTAESIEIDASGVETVGQAVLQVLIAAYAEAESHGREFMYINPSEAFIERVTKCHLSKAIGLNLERGDFR